MELWSAAAFGVFVVGLASGVLSGMFGVGGAVLTTPGIRALGASPIEAVGSTIPAILPSAISGTVRYARAGLVNWRVGLVCGGSGAVLAFVGADTSDKVNGHHLMLLTAALLGWSGYSILRSARTGPTGGAPSEVSAPGDRPAGDLGRPDSTEAEGSVGGEAGRIEAGTTIVGAATTVRPSLVALALVGSISGFIAGFLGVGGGVVMMPAFTRILRLPIKESVASSLVAVAIFSVPALGRHAQLGHIDWTYALLLVAGVVPGAQIGARITVGTSDRNLRVLAGLFFMALAVVYGVGELVDLT